MMMTDGADQPKSSEPNEKSAHEDSRDPKHDLVGDERMYTGEPVEADEGTYRPQQMNVGFETMQGGDEWPDPNAPPKPGSVGEADRTAYDADDDGKAS
jgi:hypothetical protein